jgi:hypothetical protein
MRPRFVELRFLNATVGVSLATVACLSLAGLTGGAAVDGGTPGDDGSGNALDGENTPDGSSAVAPLICAVGGQHDGGGTSDVLCARTARDGTIASWRATSSLPQSVYIGAASVIGTTAYSLGGLEGPNEILTGNVRASKANGDLLGAWRLEVTTFPAIEWLQSAAIGNRLYAIGGGNKTADTANCFVATLDSAGIVGAWTQTGPLPAARHRHAAATFGAFVYVLGGDGLGTPTNTLFRAAAAPDGALTWSTLDPLPHPSEDGRALATSSGHLYFTEGFTSGNGDRVLFTSIQPDGSLGPWQYAAPLPFGRAAHGFVFAGGFLYAIGGVDQTTNTETASVQFAAVAADGTLGAWVDTAPLPATLTGVDAVMLGE